MTDLRPAALWRLAAAALADALLGVLAWSIAAMWLVIAVLTFSRHPLDLVDDLVLALGVLLLGAALHVAYHTVLVGGCGQTLGKMLMGLAVVRVDGAPAGYGRALVRCLGGGLCVLTLGLGRVLMLFTGERRALSDFVAGTRLVARPGAEPAAPSPSPYPLPWRG
ncbi:MAG TPA: RDD family protein [Methylomirabilota bacterium]|nr:RDD family protein [Methylomirabilota bacterium]